ncbi:calcium-binding protein [Paracoccus aminovorans]|uniref:calcium-binding protein n=1 Tax=Paracoccus aminovorans TaxID=34004 RepID=UPI002B258C42|nr:calcium-binding protein [Paracoccus aminovorans]
MMMIIRNGTAGNDRIRMENLFPFSETIRVNGLAGHDELVGAFLHYNELFGGTGNDTLMGGANGNLLDGGAGNDVMDAWQSDSFSTFRGGTGNDYMRGGNGGNLFDGGTGNDTIIGGNGADIYVVDSLLDRIQETYVPYFDNDPNPADQVNSSVSWTLGANLENLTLLGTGAINGTGNGLANLIIGNSGNNTLSGGAGADTLEGGLGNDVLDGGAGIDTVRFSGATAVRINLGNANPQATGFGNDNIRNIENVLTGAGNDNIVGNAVANAITAGAGNDMLWGMAGNDRLFGQADNDRLRGGPGNDTLHGGAGADRFIFAAGDGADRINDFTDGQDRIVIESGAERFTDLRIADLGADARISFGNVTITLANFDHALLTAEDFLFT